METKICFKCGLEKGLDEFYRHTQMSDGHLNKCKDCAKTDTAIQVEKNKTIPGWKESERERGREKYHRLGYKKQSTIYRMLYPEKRAAVSATQHMTKPGLEIHHWSYNEEHFKDVFYFQIEHHRKLHRHLIYDQERMMFRRCDNLELLDNRETHQEFANFILTKQQDK